MPTSQLSEDSDTDVDKGGAGLLLELLTQRANNRGDVETLVFPAIEGLRGLYSTRLYAGDAEYYFKPGFSRIDLFPMLVTRWLVPDLCGGSIGVIIRELFNISYDPPISG